MNKNDSELMELSLIENGFKPSSSITNSDITIYNTCSVRQHAEDRVISRIQSSKNELKKGLTIITGCMAQRIGPELINSGLADMIIGPYQSPEIGRILLNYFDDNTNKSYLSQDRNDFSGRIKSNLSDLNNKQHWHEWVTITHGCENYCSYCIVPAVRGKLISFQSEDILNHITMLASTGITEVTLLGQNVNQYGTDTNDIPFYKLLDKTAQITGIKRINFLTSHPKDFSKEIIEVIANHENISKSIHLPLQSGSNNILKQMNRTYSIENYLDIVATINRYLSEFSITTDLIVGFPGESENEFSNTLDIVRSVKFDDAYMYAYSPREGTPAFKMNDDLSREEKISRLNRLIHLQRSISHEKLKLRINQIEVAIVENFSKKSLDRVMGRTYLNHIVILPGTEEDFGKKIKIKIDEVKGSTLQGTRIA